MRRFLIESELIFLNQTGLKPVNSYIYLHYLKPKKHITGDDGFYVTGVFFIFQKRLLNSDKRALWLN